MGGQWGATKLDNRCWKIQRPSGMSIRNDVRNERWERKKGLFLLKLNGACATTRESTENAERKGRERGKETGKITSETVPSQADLFKAEGKEEMNGSK